MSTLIKNILVLIAALFILSCCKAQTAEEQQVEHQKHIRRYERQTISYFQDTRTGICFMRVLAANDYHLLGPVECTKKVMDLITDPAYQ